MADDCKRSELRARTLDGESLDEAGRERWRRHLEDCPACRVQASVDEGLRRTLAAVPPPPLPSDFVQRFEGRRAAVAAAEGSPWLRAYWAAFTVVSLWVLAGIDWSLLAGGLRMLGTVAVAILAASPLLALVGPLRPLIGIPSLGGAGRRSQGVTMS